MVQEKRWSSKTVGYLDTIAGHQNGSYFQTSSLDSVDVRKLHLFFAGRWPAAISQHYSHGWMHESK